MQNTCYTCLTILRQRLVPRSVEPTMDLRLLRGDFVCFTAQPGHCVQHNLHVLPVGFHHFASSLLQAVASISVCLLDGCRRVFHFGFAPRLHVPVRRCARVLHQAHRVDYRIHGQSRPGCVSRRGTVVETDDSDWLPTGRHPAVEILSSEFLTHNFSNCHRWRGRQSC